MYYILRWTRQIPSCYLCSSLTHPSTTTTTKGLKMGWYFNGCGCIEVKKPASGWDVNYEGDIQALYDLGFDGVKFGKA